MAWTDIAEFVLDKVFGYQSANLLRGNLIALKDAGYVVRSKLAPNDFLVNAQALDVLPTGYLKTTGGTLSSVPGISSGDLEPHASSHDTGGDDEITALDAAVLTSGVLDVARLPVNSKKQVLRHAIAHFTSPGSGIATGPAGVLVVPWNCTITEVILLSSDPAFTAGSIVIDIWKDSYTNYPPTVADTICASAKPTLSSANKSRDTTLTGWTTALAAGDILAFNVDSATTVQHVAISLLVTLT